MREVVHSAGGEEGGDVGVADGVKHATEGRLSRDHLIGPRDHQPTELLPLTNYKLNSHIILRGMRVREREEEISFIFIAYNCAICIYFLLSHLSP